MDETELKTVCLPTSYASVGDSQRSIANEDGKRG